MGTTDNPGKTPVADAKLRYQDEEVVRSYDRVRFGNLIGRTTDALEKRAVSKAIVRLRRGTPSPSVLDVPCGTGRITEFLLEQGLEVAGGDISVPMLEIARGKLARFGRRLSLRRLDLDELDLPDQSFDLVTCIRLLNHLVRERRAGVLRELSRVSRRFVIVNVSFCSGFYRVAPLFLFNRLIGKLAPREPSTWTELKGQTAAAGLRIREYYFQLRYLSEKVVLVLEKV